MVPSVKSFIYFKNKRRPNTDAYGMGTPRFIFLISIFLRSVIYPCNNEIIISSWAAMASKFQCQKVRDDCLEPRLISVSPPQYIYFNTW